jgi:hypothetical protein
LDCHFTGHYVMGYLLNPFSSLTIGEAVTRSSIAGGATKYVCNSLIFSHPHLIEDSDNPGTFGKHVLATYART